MINERGEDMSKVILVGHGKIAEGIKSAAEVIVGNCDDVDAISLLPSDSVDDFNKSLDESLSDCQKDELIVIFADLAGGTPANQSAYRLTEYENLHVIAGINLPLVIETLVQRNNEHIDFKELVANAQNGMIYLNEMLQS